MVVLHLCIFLLLFISLFIFLRKQTERYSGSSSCIITLTAYMGFENRFDNIDNVLGPLVATGQEIIVINEWDHNYTSYIDFMKKNYPNVRFIQKTKDDNGQARSLNILVRDHLLYSTKKYWIHWEDAWVCARPLLPDLVRIMDEHPQITQLQATDDWKEVSPKQTTDLGDAKILIPQHNYDKDIYEAINQVSLDSWPLFSLRPSINRLSFFQRHARDFYFLEDPHLWPIRFEWEFGRIFLRNNGVKAITKKPYAKRTAGCKSTYFKMFTAVPSLTK